MPQDLASITGSGQERGEKLNEYRDALAARAKKDDNVAVSTEDVWEGHKWWAAKVVRALYTVKEPFSRGDMDFEEGERVMDVMYYDVDTSKRLAPGDNQFFLLDVVDTVFSFSVVDIKFPMTQQLGQTRDDEPIVPTYLLKKADCKGIDKSVRDQEDALQA